jgi:2-keto-3-deoxy-galactonokinase
VNNKLEKMWKEAVAAYFMVQTFNLSAATEKNQEKSQVRVVCVGEDILTAMRQLCRAGVRCFVV